MKRLDGTLVALLSVLLFGVLAAVIRGEPMPTPGGGGEAQLSGVLGGGRAAERFAKVTGPRPFDFPADHGAHPDYRSEWWYFTGNLVADDGGRYGFQLTFFRFALAPEMAQRASRFATRQAWMAHFALTDLDAGSHRAVERFQRGALGLAGAQTRPRVAVWLDDWRMQSTGEALFPLTLRAEADGMALDLRLESMKPRVLQGERGYSPKSDRPGNASHYYSYTRLAATGTVALDGARRVVEGRAWLDREWSTSALADDQAGWDWFALQLADGRDLMVYRMRGTDGSTDPASAGVLVTRDGAVTRLGAGDFALREVDHWRSPTTGARYPVVWRLEVPGEGLRFRVRAAVRDQEMDLAFRYWEGAVVVEPLNSASSPGRGYLEMTGYGAPPARR